MVPPYQLEEADQQSYEAFSQATDPIFEAGLKPKLIDPTDLPDEGSILIPIGVGGGITRERARAMRI